ncbi:hypothetical protein SFRURICE_000886 [Spodoptera frugiperda]|nr:hypothetical protein SFRURICE_000886 [Spodoptera frugiperda]
MRAVILVMAVASAVAALDLNSPDIAVPAVLEGAAPEDVLLYLYDVVLTSFMQNEPNDQGGLFQGSNCPGGSPSLKSGKCPDPTPVPQDNLELFRATPGVLQEQRMRAVILVMAVASAVAALDLNSPDIAVPAVLEGAAPEDVLLYLYDVVLTSFMQNEPNNQGSIATGRICPGGLRPLTSGNCPDAIGIQMSPNSDSVYG